MSLKSTGFSRSGPVEFAYSASFDRGDEETRVVVLGVYYAIAHAVSSLTPSGAEIWWRTRFERRSSRPTHEIERVTLHIMPLDESVRAGGPAHRRLVEEARRVADRYADRLATVMGSCTGPEDWRAR